MTATRKTATAALFVALQVALGDSIPSLGQIYCTPHGQEVHTPPLRVRPSYLLRDIDRQLGRRRSIPPGQLIAEANSEVTRRGFDYEFEVSSFIAEHKLRPLGNSDPNTSERTTYEFDMATADGRSLRLQVEVGTEGACGERETLIPTAHLSKQEIDLVVNSQHYRLKRPATFDLKWMQLVDEQTKKTLRTWELPFDAQPLGVSPDGRTLFFLPNFNIYAYQRNLSSRLAVSPVHLLARPEPAERPSHLILAASNRGVQFADAYDLIERESSETLEDRDPKFPYVGYKRFHVGGKSYVVRFQWPCT